MIDQCTPIVRRKKAKQRVREADTDSGSSGSEVDVSCSRLVEFHQKDAPGRPNIYRRGPTVGSTPIALRTRSRISKTYIGHYLVLATVDREIFAGKYITY
jgi:hypothetical protein